VLDCKGDSQSKTLALSSTYVILVVVLLLLVLLLFIWLKLFIRPPPVAFCSECVEGPIFLCDGSTAKVAKAIEHLEVEAQPELGCGRHTILATKETSPPPFYTKNGPFHLIKSHPVALQSLGTHLDIIVYMLQALLVNAHGAIPEIMVAKRYLQFYISVPYKRYTATTFNDNPKLSTSGGKWENSHNFYLESFNCLHYSLVSLNIYNFGLGCEYPKSAIFGVKRGGSFLWSYHT